MDFSQPSSAETSAQGSSPFDPRPTNPPAHAQARSPSSSTPSTGSGTPTSSPLPTPPPSSQLAPTTTVTAKQPDSVPANPFAETSPHADNHGPGYPAAAPTTTTSRPNRHPPHLTLVDFLAHDLRQERKRRHRLDPRSWPSPPRGLRTRWDVAGYKQEKKRHERAIAELERQLAEAERQEREREAAGTESADSDDASIATAAPADNDDVMALDKALDETLADALRPMSLTEPTAGGRASWPYPPLPRLRGLVDNYGGWDFRGR